MSESISLVHIARPGRLPFCDNLCLRRECLEAIEKGLPLLCEAYSQQDMERIEVEHGGGIAKQTLMMSEIYRIGLAFLVVMAEYENRKKYKGQELGEAIFAFLRIARDDPDYFKRIAILLISVAITQEHFNLDDIETMFGADAVVAVSPFIPLPNETLHYKPYLRRLASDPLTLELALSYYRAKLDWLKISQGADNDRRRWTRCINTLLKT